MTRNVMFSKEIKLEVVKKYLEGSSSTVQLAYKYGCHRETILTWVKRYKSLGDEAFTETHKNQSYKDDFKKMVVEEYLKGEGTYSSLTIKYNVSSKAGIFSWVKLYNDHKELKSSKPNGGMIMTKGRKTTYEEKIEIVEDCLRNGLDYTGTAIKFNVSYQQIYRWISKFNAKGAIALKDNRGRGKSFEEMDEVEQLKAENKLLKARLDRFELEQKLKKKLQEVQIRLVSTTKKKK